MEFVVPGALLGFAMAQGRFCLNSGLADAVFKSDFRKVGILILAVLLQSVFLLRLFPGENPRLQAGALPGGVAVGGFVFGLLMPVAGGCPGGILFKAAEGQVSAMFALAGFSLGTGLAFVGSAAPILEAARHSEMLWDTRVSGLALLAWPSAAFGLLLLVLFKWKNSYAEGAVWTWKKTGIFIGIAALLYSILAEARPGAAPLGIVPGFISAWQGRLSPELWFIGAVAAGALASAVARAGFALQPAPPSRYVMRLLGGLGLGGATALASGCSVGYGLTFLPLLSTQALLAMTAILLGRIVSEIPRRLRKS